MSIQWTVIAGFLYCEIAVVIIMMLPICSPRRWNRLFNSRLLTWFSHRVAMYFYIALGVMCLFLIDAVREMRKYTPDGCHVHLASEMRGNLKLFRAQRNFHITSFAIFLAFVIRRLVNMIIIQDELTTKAERIIKQAESTVNLAKTTVLANSIQTEEAKQYHEVVSQMKLLEEQYEEEKERAMNLEKEVVMWKTLFEEVTIARGKGDQ